MSTLNSFTIDVEDWFHILDTPYTPSVDDWGSFEPRVANNVEKMLDLLAQHEVKATFFWLGWVAEQNRSLLNKCVSEGHEISSHGYAHLLPYKVSAERFGEDITRAKNVLEDLSGSAVLGFRAPGFGITAETPWAFDVIKQAGYEYDSSIFPTDRGHGGLKGTPSVPHVIETDSGPLPEFPMSVIEVLGKRISLFGGGYLRLAPQPVIRWGIRQLKSRNRPLIVYIHPREIDPDHPRLPLNRKRTFKSYFNLKSTYPKLNSILARNEFVRMREMVPQLLSDQENKGSE